MKPERSLDSLTFGRDDMGWLHRNGIRSYADDISAAGKGL